MRSTPIAYKKVPHLNELQAAFPSLKATYFDMDGTLFNTESIHAAAMYNMARKYKIRPPHPPEVIHGLLMGKADHLVFDIIKYWEGFPEAWKAQDFVEEKNLHLLELLNKTPPETYFAPEVAELLSSIHNQGLFKSLITSSEKIITQELLKITKLETYFDLVLTRDDCPRHKPDPWPYLKASEISGHNKHEILIFEDSHVGIEAATATGSHVIKVEWY